MSNLGTYNTVFTGILICLTIILILFLNYLLNKKNKKQLDNIFIMLFILLIISILPTILQMIFINKTDKLIYFDYFSYIGVCYLPVCFVYLSLIFAKTKIKFTRKLKSLLILPTISIILLWTNDWHHLFYQEYSINLSEIKLGNYFYIHYFYTILLFAISIFILMKYSIKNSGFFSKQAILILIGVLIPIVTNVLAYTGLIPGLNITSISLGATVILFSLAMFKFDLFKLTPIALQTIVDRISDSYVVLNDNYEITDFNATFIKTFKINNPYSLRRKHFAVFLKDIGLKDKIKDFAKHIEKIDNKKDAETFELRIRKLNKTFNIEITSIIVNGQFLGILVLFKDITQHINDMQEVKNNQELLIEQERLASLGQMIGGIAHNLKTPIFSVSGGLEGLSDLIKEFDESIDDPTVNNKDMHDIAKDMKEWIEKLREHVTYMSDVITTVKGQAVSMSEEQRIDFPVSELFQHVNILMQHILKQQLATLEINNEIPDNIKINGNINSLVQVVNNLISNSIEAYGNSSNKLVILSAKRINNQIVISVTDFGPGLPNNVKSKLFKEMITTKGKNGTGLGLFMSYSNIKAHFNGTITFDTSSKGTTFNIIIPNK